MIISHQDPILSTALTLTFTLTLTLTLTTRETRTREADGTNDDESDESSVDGVARGRVLRDGRRGRDDDAYRRNRFLDDVERLLGYVISLSLSLSLRS